MALDIGSLLSGFPQAQGGVPFEIAQPPGMPPMMPPVGVGTPPFVPPTDKTGIGGAANPVEQNKGLWRGFFDKMNTDPNFKQAVMQTGLAMMRSPQVGQNGFDVAANALGAGVGTLANLRELDRKRALEMQDRSLNEEKVRNEMTNRTANTELNQEQVNIQKTDMNADNKRGDQQLDLAVKNYEETVRSNKSQEAIEMAKARMEAEWRKIYGTGSMPGDIQKIMMLKDEFMRTNPGMSEVEARAKALQKIQTEGKQKPDGDRMMAGFNSQMQAWMANPANIGKEPTPEEIQGMLGRARQAATAAGSMDAGDAMTLPQTSTPAPAGANPNPKPTVAPPGAGRFSGAPTQVVNPQVKMIIERQVKAGVSPTILRQGLIAKGLKPEDYGL